MTEEDKVLFVKLRLAGHAVVTTRKEPPKFVCPHCFGAWSVGANIRQCAPVAQTVSHITADQLAAGSITADKITAGTLSSLKR